MAAKRKAKKSEEASVPKAGGPEELVYLENAGTTTATLHGYGKALSGEKLDAPMRRCLAERVGRPWRITKR